MKVTMSNCLVLIISLLSCAAISAAGSSIGASYAKSSMYIDEADAASFDSGAAVVLNASLSLNKVFFVPGFSIEAEYSKSMGPISYEFSNVARRGGEFVFEDILRRNYDHQTIGGYIAFDFISLDSVVLKTRFGYVLSSATDETLVMCRGECDARDTPPTTIGGIRAIPNSSSLSGGGISLGLSLSYVFFKHLYGAVEFTRTMINYPGQTSQYGLTYMSVGVGLSM